MCACTGRGLPCGQLPTLPAHASLARPQCAGISPSTHTLSLLLGALVAGGAASDALWLLREALAQGYDLAAPAFNGVLQVGAAGGGAAA